MIASEFTLAKNYILYLKYIFTSVPGKRGRNYFFKNEKDKGCGGGIKTTKDPKWGRAKVERLGKDSLMKCWQQKAGLEGEKSQQVWMGECKS